MIDCNELRIKPERAIYVTQVCPECHKKFTFNKQISRRKKYCCNRCMRTAEIRRNKNKRKRYYIPTTGVIKTCPRCGKEFKANGNAKLCKECLIYLAGHAEHNRSDYIETLETRQDCIDVDTQQFRHSNEVVFNGYIYPNKKAMCRFYGVNYSSFTWHYNKLKSVELAMKKAKRV